MHWPKGSDIQRIDGKDAIVILRDRCSLGKKDFDAEMLQELLRSALVLGVSALDRYMHERIVKNIVAALKKRKLCKEQQEFAIPATLAIQVADCLVTARRKNQTVRPANEIRNAIQEILHKRTFQSWREMEEGFRLIGISGIGGKLQAAYGNGNMKPIYARLDKIVYSRNRIVHEADLVRHKKGGRPRMHPIKLGDVRGSITFLDDLVTKLEKITA
jgi:hypothetical protein